MCIEGDYTPFASKHILDNIDSVDRLIMASKTCLNYSNRLQKIKFLGDFFREIRLHHKI